MKTVITSNRWSNDPSSRGFVAHLTENQHALNLTNAILYYDFPAYTDYEQTLFRPDILLFSPSHGFFAIRFFDTTLFQQTADSIEEVDESLSDFCSNLHSRLIRSRNLRKNRTTTVVEIHPVIFCVGEMDVSEELDAETCSSMEAIEEYFSSKEIEPLGEAIVDEIRSVTEGAKAITRVQKRVIKDSEAEPLAAAMSALEGEIANFDERQRTIAITSFEGPARIRGLAGSGKTIILAMKAAHLHRNNPEAKILFTFFTKSLRATIKTLITKFFRLYSDNDPDWKRIHIRHSWGGASVPGVYSEACLRANERPKTLSDARQIARRGETAFAAICSNLLETGNVKPFYDHVLIDEGQDFPDSFYRLALQLTNGTRDRKNIVWAYDELQDIMNVKIRQPNELFGYDDDGEALVDLDRTSQYLPPGATNDAVLEKAYRNQLDVLLVAHALGFGIYGEIVQMLESKEHWEDVGYTVNSGSLVTGEEVEITRPSANSPLPIPNIDHVELIDFRHFEDFSREMDWVAQEVQRFIEGGLSPEEILVISLDDRFAKSYLSKIAERLSLNGVSSNNIIADPYNEPPFSITGKVTLSTVYRAKGNEASAVLAVGIDALETQSRAGRNRIFTAFTRTKAWLRISGIGERAKQIFAELEQAKNLSPTMKFTMPDLDQIETIQRGFSKKQAAAKAARKSYVESLRKAGLSEAEIDEELAAGHDIDRS